MVNFVEAYHFSDTVKESAFVCLAFIFFCNTLSCIYLLFIVKEEQEAYRIFYFLG